VSFADLLDEVVLKTPGAVAATLMGFDGIAIESRSSALSSSVNTQAAAVELGAIATTLKGVADGLGAGDVREVTLQTDGLITVLRPITSEYFVALSLVPDGLTGKGRYLMRMVAPKLAAELS
jgi:predicted regulator of Ras-like GTPase activity (Roadblock/LC7/MglB family)